MKPVLSLRWKLVLALVATSGLTLLAAGAALVPQLQHRLTRDRLNALRQSARAAHATFVELGPGDVRPGSPALRKIVLTMQRGNGARVAVFDASGQVLADSDPDRVAPDADSLEERQDAVIARQGGRRSAVVTGEAIVVRQEQVDGHRLTLVLRKQLNDTKAAISLIRRGLPLAAGVALLIALLVGIALSFGLLRRLERLRLEARRLRDEGIDTPMAVDRSGDEVGEVARALEAMRARLHADEQARQAFLSTASHELRTPVASLQGTLELLDEELYLPQVDLERVRVRARAAMRQTHRIAGLTTDLLDLSRLDGEVDMRSEPLELSELASSVLSEFELRAADEGIEIVHAAGKQVWALADAPAVARILRILVDNALRYGGGPLTVTLGADGGQAWMRVADGGPGIELAERELIFARFERGEQSGGQPGFGLGLPIGRELARRMDGDLVVLDERPGATFELTLPAAPPSA